MIGLLIVLAGLLLIGVTKVGVRVIWDGDLQLHLVAGPLRIALLNPHKKVKPSKEKPKVPVKKKNAPSAETGSKKQGPVEQPSKQTSKESKKKKEINPWIGALLAHWMELLELVGRVLRMPQADELQLRVTFGGADPADTALNYGRACAAAGALLPVLQNSVRVNSPNVEIVYDEHTSEMQIYVCAVITVRIYQIFALVFAAIGLLFKIYQAKKRNEKAVQQ